MRNNWYGNPVWKPKLANFFTKLYSKRQMFRIFSLFGMTNKEWIAERMVIRLALSALDELLRIKTHWRWANLDDLFGKNIYNVRNNWMSVHRNSLPSLLQVNNSWSPPLGRVQQEVWVQPPTPPPHPRYDSHYFVFPLQYDIQLEIWLA